jgi:ABC-type multidrug transport system fused ATPase/permease subunit
VRLIISSSCAVNDTIGNNIAYGAPGATRAEIVEAAKQANAHDFIMEFADNYDTPVGERGTQLSGGQKQRYGSLCNRCVEVRQRQMIAVC